MICIDPGLRGAGVAVFEGETLACADYIKNPQEGRGYRAHAALALRVSRHCKGLLNYVIVEHPQVYPGMPKTDLNDLLDVVAVGAACAHAIGTVMGTIETVYPRQWKGTMDKQAMLKRIWSKLSPTEQAVVQKTNKSDTEDILDAIGIGLWKLGRLNNKVYPGAT